MVNFYNNRISKSKNDKVTYNQITLEVFSHQAYRNSRHKQNKLQTGQNSIYQQI